MYILNSGNRVLTQKRLLFKIVVLLAFLSLNFSLFSQKTFYGEIPVKWSDYSTPVLPENLEKYNTYDIVIINDETEFDFYAKNNERIIRNITFKINTESGLNVLKTYHLPESFDQAYDANYYLQGRRSRIKTPFIKEYEISKFAARKYVRNRWTDVSFNLKYEKIRWVRPFGDFAGEFMDEDLNVFNFQDLSVGDVVQLVYEAAFNSAYGNNLFYFNSSYPKLHCGYTFSYKVNQKFADYAFILPINIKDTSVKRARRRFNDYEIITHKIDLYNLEGINYPAHSFPGKTLPHTFADFSFYRVLNNSFPDGGSRIYQYELYRPENFKWLIFPDTANYYTKIYDKQFSALRKFVSKMPPILGTDSTNKGFFKALCDTLNSFRYLSSNHIFYNDANLRDVYSGEHLLKRRISENLLLKLYRDILNDNKIFYSLVNVQDKRFGEHTPLYHAAYAYETALVAIPSKDSYIYFMPRYQGLKYHLNELPFYFEGTLALLNPRNFQSEVKNKDSHFFKFIKTHRGTFNENTRTENAMVRICLDSLKADVNTKESLSGQFSTILRHLYLNELIDSTISPHYFKKCVDKPFSSEVKIKLSSKMTDFPFRYNFNCSEHIALPGDKHLRLKNWFSFPVSKNVLPEKPNHDYYFDFDFSDSYNFLLNFKEAVELKNSSSFAKQISNDYFELESEILKNSENSFLLKVKLVVKQTKIPVDKLNLLMQLVDELETLNDFSLELVRK